MIHPKVNLSQDRGWKMRKQSTGVRLNQTIKFFLEESLKEQFITMIGCRNVSDVLRDLVDGYLSDSVVLPSEPFHSKEFDTSLSVKISSETRCRVFSKTQGTMWNVSGVMRHMVREYVSGGIVIQPSKILM